MASTARRIGANILFHASGAPHRLVDAYGPDVVKHIEDFTSIAAASDALTGWTTTLVEAGAGESTVTIADGSGGHLLLTTDANENDGINLQKTGEAFKCASGNQLYFGARVKASEATQSDFAVGLCITDTDLLGGMTDGIYFECLDGGTGISCVTEKNSTETQTDSAGTFAADTWFTLEFYFDGTSVFFYIDGTLVATHTTNIVDDEEITPSVQFLAGSAGAKTMTIDFFRTIQIGRN